MNLTATFTYNTLYRIVNIALVYAIVVFVSKLAGVAGYGLLSILIVNATFYNLASSFGADAGITYHSANATLQPGKITTIIFCTLTLQMIILGVIRILSYDFISGVSLIQNNLKTYWWSACLFLLSISLTEKYTAFFNGHYLFNLCGKLLVFTNLLTLIVFLFLFFYSPVHEVVYVVTVYVGMAFFQSLVLVTIFHLRIKKSFSIGMVSYREIKSFLSFSIIAFITNIIQFMAYRADYWLVDYFRTEKELGWYSLAVRLVQVFWVLPLLFAGILFPQVAKEKGLYDENKMLSFIRVLFCVNFLGGLLAFFLVQWMIPVVFGKIYDGSIVPFQILLPGIILFCPTTVIAAFFAGRGQLLTNLFGSSINFVFIVLIDILLIPSLGIKGAAIASSIGYTLTSIYFITVYCRQTQTPFYQLFYPRMSDWHDLRASIYKISIKET